MVDLLLIAHAPLASALRGVALHAFPDLVGSIAACDLPPGGGDDLQRDLQQAREAAARLDARHELLILTDVGGATPANVACALARERAAAVLAGASVPMMWRALNYRHLPLAQVAERAREGGAMCIQALITPAPAQQRNFPEPPHAAEGSDHHQ